MVEHESRGEHVKARRKGEKYSEHVLGEKKADEKVQKLKDQDIPLPALWSRLVGGMLL